MARGPAMTAEALAKLGADRLAALVLEEASRNAPFKKLAAAALAGSKGPDAVAALIDRRLSALERARGAVDWQKNRAFAADLRATVSAIAGELGALDPLAAIDRLMRFARGAGVVFDRVEDHGGAVAAVYEAAAEALPRLAAGLPEDERAEVAARLAGDLGKDYTGALARSLRASIALLPPDRLPALDAVLAAADEALPRDDGRGGRDWRAAAHREALFGARQAVADRAGDVDAFITLEKQRRGEAVDTLAVAERLLGAGRLAEALDWARRRPRRGVGFLSFQDLADGAPVRDRSDHDRALLEIRVLDAMGDHGAAQDLRWAMFEAELEPAILRDIVDHSPDFGEFEALDRAFARAAAHPRRYAALSFFVAWPRLDLAARLVLDHRGAWDGGQWGVLASAAEALDADQPAAATVLYRALVDDILGQGRSQAYGHAARHLAALEALAPRADGAADHAAYRAGLRRAHARKASFWSLVAGP